MPKPLTEQQRTILEKLYYALRGHREQMRGLIGELEASITRDVHKMGEIHARMDVLAYVLGLPEGASRE